MLKGTQPETGQVSGTLIEGVGRGLKSGVLGVRVSLPAWRLVPSMGAWVLLLEENHSFPGRGSQIITLRLLVEKWERLKGQPNSVSSIFTIGWRSPFRPLVHFGHPKLVRDGGISSGMSPRFFRHGPDSGHSG